MPKKSTIEHARKAKKEGKAPTTQAGEFVHEEIDHVRQGKHGARSSKQVIAIGLSKARRAGVKVPAAKRSTPKRRATSTSRKRAPKAASKRASRARSLATTRALKREGQRAASPRALSRQARSAARARATSTRGPKKTKRSTRASHAPRAKRSS